MASLTVKPLSVPPVAFQGLFFITIIILLVYSSSISVFAYTSSVTTEEGREVDALLKWKDSLQNSTRFHLSSSKHFPPLNSTSSMNSSSNLKRSSSSSPSNWVGITCDKSGSITDIDLQNHSLRGTLHDFDFTSFPNLLHLDLSNNSLYGFIPSPISNLSKLIYLDLSFNYLSGSVPREIHFLTSLRYFYIIGNEINGSISEEIGMLRSLNDLDFYKNKLTGPIPAVIGNLSKLTILNLPSNNFFGSIPQEVTMLRYLRYFAFHSNNLNGSIPMIGMGTYDTIAAADALADIVAADISASIEE